MELPTRKEFEDLFIKTAHEILGGLDSEDKITAYINGINLDDEYEGCLLGLQDGIRESLSGSVISRIGGYYYMMYPEY